MQQIVINVASPDDILSGYGAGALVRLERDTSSTMATASEITTIAVVSGKTQYEYWDATGDSTDYYRVRYSKASPSLSTDYSDYSAVFQAQSGPDYTSDGLIKSRLGITDTTDDVLFGVIAEEVNSWLESKIGFPVRPIASRDLYFDGSVVRWCSWHGGYILPCYPYGVREVTAVATSTDEGSTYTTQTLGDVLLRPHSQDRDPGWPAFELHLKLTADWTWIAYGGDANKITATTGWDVTPPELRSIATRVGVGAFRARGAGSGRQYAIGEDLNGVAMEELSSSDWYTIDRYALLKSPVL